MKKLVIGVTVALCSMAALYGIIQLAASSASPTPTQGSPGETQARNTFNILKSDPTTKMVTLSRVVSCHVGPRSCSGQLTVLTTDNKMRLIFFMDDGIKSPHLVIFNIANISPTGDIVYLTVSETYLTGLDSMISEGVCVSSSTNTGDLNINCKVSVQGMNSELEVNLHSDAITVYQR